MLRSGDDRLAIAVDEVSSNQEVVIKNVGPQVARLAGIAGATMLGNGDIVLIINPVQLITRAPEPPAVFDVAPDARDEAKAAQKRIDHVTELSTSTVPTVMVVDDSLTVRRVTQRLLERRGIRCCWRKTASMRCGSCRTWCPTSCWSTSKCRAWTATT